MKSLKNFFGHYHIDYWDTIIYIGIFDKLAGLRGLHLYRRRYAPRNWQGDLNKLLDLV